MSDDTNGKSEAMTADALPAPPSRHAGRAVGRAGLACALTMVGGLVILVAGFIIVTVGSPDATQDLSWYFALYVIPAVVIITVLLFVAAVVLGIVGIARAVGADRRASVVAIMVAAAVIAIYVVGAIILGAILSPSVTG